jgi:hypothetical protein
MAEALLGPATNGRLTMTSPRLMAIVEPSRQASVVREIAGKAEPAIVATLLEDIPAWPDDLSQFVLGVLQRVSKEPMWHWKAMPLLRLAAVRMPARFADAVDYLFNAQTNPTGAEYAASTIATLRLRQEMQDAFQRVEAAP